VLQKIGAEVPATSRGTFPVDLHRYWAVFPDRWAAFLRSHFNGDLTLIMWSIGCSERQARDWLAGKNSPPVETVLMLVDREPDVLPILLGRVA
jgi:hypothetical protein